MKETKHKRKQYTKLQRTLKKKKDKEVRVEVRGDRGSYAVCFYLFNTVISHTFHEFLKSHFLKSCSHVMLDFGPKSLPAEHAVATLEGTTWLLTCTLTWSFMVVK